MDLSNLEYVDEAFHETIYPRCNPALGDVLLTKDGANTGNVTLNTLDKPFSMLSSVCLLKPDRSLLLPKFLMYYLQSKEGLRQVTGQMTGAAIKRIILRTIKASKVPAPPLDEQRRIVAILDEAFTGIAAVRTKIERNVINANDLFLAYLRSVFEQQQPSWRNLALGEIADCSLGKMLDRAKNRGQPRPYLRNLNVRWFVFDKSELAEMRFEDAELERFSARKGDAVICEGGYPGRGAVWFEDQPVFLQKALHRVRFAGPKYAEWLVYYLYYLEQTGRLARRFTGTGIQHFTGQALKCLPIPYPSEREIGSLVAGIGCIRQRVDELILSYEKKREHLATLKSLLLQKAFSGQLSPVPIRNAAE